MQSIDYAALMDWQVAHRDFILIDVRERFEHEQTNIGGLNIPLSEIGVACGQLPQDKDIVVYCAKGIRSVIAIQKMEQRGFNRLFNLRGGIAAISKEDLT